MAGITYQEAIGEIANYSGETRIKLNSPNTQRRNSIYASYNNEYNIDGNGDNPAVFYVPISTDIDRIVRFEFKIFMHKIMPNFDNPTYGNINISIDGIDITALLNYQNALPSGGAISVYPSKDLSINYDLVKLGSALVDEQRNVILGSGFHEFIISSDGSFSGKVYFPFIVYSTVNRQSTFNNNAKLRSNKMVAVKSRITKAQIDIPTISKYDLIIRNKEVLDKFNKLKNDKNNFVECMKLKTEMVQISSMLKKYELIENVMEED